ncbi:uncharacterized protein PAC_03525 [Phialocephala subalpina]|uniref:Uncharacterized protein n=1 Tax=Phialocephala subalpina TaxID=576137 RepID=A0A1L7WLK8_9HELO|nr:uncharacterized protein PAC_03525 [Phialocephala subalpina]
MAPLASLWYLLLALPVNTLAAPVGSVVSQLFAANGNLTILRTETAPAWASSANYRGTADILWSCLLTLTACIYNAIHLNVPASYESRLRHLGRRLMWVAMALFAPEIVLYTAYAQYSEARTLVKVLNSLRVTAIVKADKEERKEDQIDKRHVYTDGGIETNVLDCTGTSENTGSGTLVDDHLRTPQIGTTSSLELNDAPIVIPPARIPAVGESGYVAPKYLTETRHVDEPTDVSKIKNMKFDLAYGFYVVMGGLIVDIRDLEDSPATVPKATLTYYGVIELARQGHFFGISPETLSDKIDVLLIKEYGNQKPLDVTEPSVIDASMCSNLIKHMTRMSNDPKIRGGTSPQRIAEITGNAFRLSLSLEISASDFPRLSEANTPGLMTMKSDLDDSILLVLSVLLPALYAGVHLSAWNFGFPSRMESLLWKISCFDLAATSVLAIFF